MLNFLELAKTINNSWKVELKKQIYVSLNEDDILAQEEAEDNPGYFDTFNTPYVAGFSEKLAKDLKT